MKINWNRKYTTITVYALIVALCVIAIAFIVFYQEKLGAAVQAFLYILRPLIYGFVIAYLLHPLYHFCNKKLYRFLSKKQSQERLQKILSILTSYLVFFILLYFFFALLVPQIISSYNDLKSRMSYYLTSAQNFIDSWVSDDNGGILGWFFTKFNLTNLSEFLKNLLSNAYNILAQIAPTIISYAEGILVGIKNAALGIVFSVYFLYHKPQLIGNIKKVCYAIFSPKSADRLVEITRYTDHTFGRYIISKLVDALLIGVTTFIILALVGMPYYALISFIIGVTNVIPFWGPFIGAIPSAFIIFIADPPMTIWFILIILILQQIDGNLIAPKIEGKSIGLNAMWVMIAVIVMGELLGIIGMFIGVPIMAVLYKIVKDIAEKRLAKKELSIETKDYLPRS